MRTYVRNLWRSSRNHLESTKGGCHIVCAPAMRSIVSIHYVACDRDLQHENDDAREAVAIDTCMPFSYEPSHLCSARGRAEVVNVKHGLEVLWVI